jgi:hypothetical protein
MQRDAEYELLDYETDYVTDDETGELKKQKSQLIALVKKIKIPCFYKYCCDD